LREKRRRDIIQTCKCPFIDLLRGNTSFELLSNYLLVFLNVKIMHKKPILTCIGEILYNENGLSILIMEVRT